LAHVYRLGLEERGALLLVPVLAQIIGSTMWGAMDRFTGSYKRSVTAGAMLTALSLAFLAWRGALDPWMLAAWLFFFGLVSAYSPPLLAHGKALFPSHQIGRGLTLLNIGSMGGAFLTQALSGAIIEAFPPLPDGSYELRAYQVVFGLQALLILLALLIYFPSRNPQ
jgi:MFS family permease